MKLYIITTNDSNGEPRSASVHAGTKAAAMIAVAKKTPEAGLSLIMAREATPMEINLQGSIESRIVNLLN